MCGGQHPATWACGSAAGRQYMGGRGLPPGAWQACNWASPPSRSLFLSSSPSEESRIDVNKGSKERGSALKSRQTFFVASLWMRRPAICRKVFDDVSFQKATGPGNVMEICLTRTSCNRFNF